MTTTVDTVWRPLAHVAITDDELREQVGDSLRGLGWAVIDTPSGYHLLQSIAGLLIESAPWVRPSLIVADAFSPGCAGVSIARGLRELGWSTPVVLLISSADEAGRINARPEESIIALDRALAGKTIAELARQIGAAGAPALARREEEPAIALSRPQSHPPLTPRAEHEQTTR